MTVTDIFDVRAKFDRLDAALNSELVERRQEIRSVVLALLARQHIFLLGSHGIAKSMLARRLAGWVGARCFITQLHPFMEPDELDGPLDFNELDKSGRRVHMVTGYLPDTEMALLDEFWEAGPALLKTLNTILNEGKFANGNEEIDVPLAMAMLASNRLPDFNDAGLVATYDRILVRHEVSRVKDRRNKKKMLKIIVPDQDEPILTWHEVLRAQSEVAATEIADEVYDALCDVDDELGKERIHPSPRRLKESLSLIRAAAWLEGCAIADVGHMRILEHVLWDHPDHKATVIAVVRKLASPLEEEANQLLAHIERYAVELDEILDKPKGARKGRAKDLHGKVERTLQDLEELRGKAGQRHGALLDHVGDRIYDLTAKMLSTLFDVPEDDVEAAIAALAS